MSRVFLRSHSDDMSYTTTHPPPAPLTELQVLSNYFALQHKKIFTTSNGASILNFVHSRHSPRVFFSINAAVCSALFPYNHTLTVCLLCILLQYSKGGYRSSVQAYTSQTKMSVGKTISTVALQYYCQCCKKGRAVNSQE